MSVAVSVGGQQVGAIGAGLLILAGVGKDDTEAAARRLGVKVARLRIFSDDQGKMNRSVLEVGGRVLVVSQFTLYADTRKGYRPSFVDAARPELAVPLLDAFADELRAAGIEVAEGRFGAHMQVSLINDGPVTIILEA